MQFLKIFYSYNIIWEIFLGKIYASILQNALLDDYALMLAHLNVHSYGPKHLPIPVTNLVYTPGYKYNHIWCFYLLSKSIFK